MEENQRQSEAAATDGLKTFRAQMQAVRYLLSNFVRDTTDLRESVRTAKECMSAGIIEGPLQVNHLYDLRVTLERVNEALTGAAQKAGYMWQAHPYIFDWMLVMTVTYTEAYLENALLVVVNASRVGMRTKEKLWVTMEEVLQFESEGDAEQQLDEFKQLMWRRWAKAFLSDRPSTWIAKLTKMGVSTFEPTLASDMNRIWTRRHELVHAPPPPLDMHATKKRLDESRRVFEEAANVAYDSVYATDLYVVRVLEQNGIST